MTESNTPAAPAETVTPEAEERAAIIAAIVRDVHLEHKWTSHEDRSGGGDCWCDENLSWLSQDDGHSDHVAQKIVEALTARGFLTAT